MDRCRLSDPPGDVEEPVLLPPPLVTLELPDDKSGDITFELAVMETGFIVCMSFWRVELFVTVTKRCTFDCFTVAAAELICCNCKS